MSLSNFASSIGTNVDQSNTYCLPMSPRVNEFRGNLEYIFASHLRHKFILER